MQVMHYPVGTLCRSGAVELFVGTTYWVAYQDPAIAARVRVALASQFTVDEALSLRGAKLDAEFNKMVAEMEAQVAAGDTGPVDDQAVHIEQASRNVGRIEAAKQLWLSRGRQRMLIVSQFAQEIRDGKL
jgi:hypothetical protein